MQESKRQKQVAAVLEKELNAIFQHLGLTVIQGVLVSISSVKLTPDLSEARVYLSFYNSPHPDNTLKSIEERMREIKKQLAAAVRHQLRIVPLLTFFVDDTLAYVDKMENLFKEIHNQDKDKTSKK
jgi:ribosome-binding factor A